MKILNERPDNFESALSALLSGVEEHLKTKIQDMQLVREEETRLHYHAQLANGREMLVCIHVHKLNKEYALRFTGNYI